jgi:hypothetical protein
VIVMLALNDRIARLELRSEQLVIRLRSIDRISSETEAGCYTLLAMPVRLADLKGRRLRLEAELAPDGAQRPSRSAVEARAS